MQWRRGNAESSPRPESRVISSEGLRTAPCVHAHLQVLPVNEEKHGLVRIVDNNASLVLAAQYMQKLFFIVTVMKLKFSLIKKHKHRYVTLPQTCYTTWHMHTVVLLYMLVDTATSLKCNLKFSFSVTLATSHRLTDHSRSGRHCEHLFTSRCWHRTAWDLLLQESVVPGKSLPTVPTTPPKATGQPYNSSLPGP